MINRISRLVLLLTTLTVTLGGCSGLPVHSATGTETTVILIRHADRHNSPELSELGRQRAQLLVDAVKDMGITTIYSPNIGRNLDTVTPLANALGIDITITPKFTLLYVDQIADEIIKQHAGEVVLIVGNVSGNLQAMYKKLGGTGDGPMEYGDLSIIRIKDKGPAEVIRKRFGPPSQEEKKA